MEHTTTPKTFKVLYTETDSQGRLISIQRDCMTGTEIRKTICPEKIEQAKQDLRSGKIDFFDIYSCCL